LPHATAADSAAAKEHLDLAAELRRYIHQAAIRAVMALFEVAFPEHGAVKFFHAHLSRLVIATIDRDADRSTLDRRR
jgi:hypothetical protein